ncbi:MAG: bifunctional pyr operon transcriptional regulator/uracil phosphoribosyltransferase PyrR [Phycisphaerae bacterium]
MADVLEANKLKQAMETLAQGIADGLLNSSYPLAVVGIRSRGDILGHRLIELIEARGVKVSKQGVLDITLYRDDLDQVGGQARVRATQIDFDISDYVIILVDDVLFTGRTVRAALDALIDLGRPRAIKLAVLVDRGGRELPIQPDFVGLKLPHTDKHVQVRFVETDGVDKIIVKE